jgi:hypothetical protein
VFSSLCFRLNFINCIKPSLFQLDIHIGRKKEVRWSQWQRSLDPLEAVVEVPFRLSSRTASVHFPAFAGQTPPQSSSYLVPLTKFVDMYHNVVLKCYRDFGWSVLQNQIPNFLDIFWREASCRPSRTIVIISQCSAIFETLIHVASFFGGSKLLSPKACLNIWWVSAAAFAKFKTELYTETLLSQVSHCKTAHSRKQSNGNTSTNNKFNHSTKRQYIYVIWTNCSSPCIQNGFAL